MHEKLLHPFLQVQTIDTYFSLTLLQYKEECCMKKPYTTEQRNLHQCFQSQMMRLWNLDPIAKITNRHRHSHQNRNLHHLSQKGTCWPPSSTYLIKRKRTSQLSMGEASCRPFKNQKKKNQRENARRGQNSEECLGALSYNDNDGTKNSGDAHQVLLAHGGSALKCPDMVIF